MQEELEVEALGQPSPKWFDTVNARLEGRPPQDVLSFGLDTYGTNISLASSFGAEDLCLVDMLSRLGRPFRVFYLDTDVLFQETYETIARAERHYGQTFERYTPLLTLEEQAAQHGEALWSSNPDACCGIRKVEPLRRALRDLSAWITGIRRDQTPARATARLVEWDARNNLIKLNPLAAWSNEDVWTYIRENNVPYNPLHDQGYPSVGCMHCTRPVRPGEDPRAGRWAGFAKTECGLHSDH